MLPNDKVWVAVSRDKERSGQIISTQPDNYFDVLIEGSTSPKTYHRNDLRISSATKHDQEKNRLELIPVSGIYGIGRAMTFGAKKYSENNWANGFDYTRLCGSAMRHLVAWMSGEDKDPESGLSHLDHLGACVVMLIAHETEGLGNDDRRKTNN